VRQSHFKSEPHTIPTVELKSFSINTLIKHRKVFANSFECGIHIELNREVQPKVLISLVLIIKVKNAYQANAENPDAKVKISTQLDENGRPQVSVSDNGPGISEELMDKIFIPFFTTKENGTGIGLSVSRQIMQLHGGSLKISSIPGKITSAILTF